MTYTPDYISELAPNEVFVFGSNLDGWHCGGAARTALYKFGAVWGQSVGLQGQSYAIPTMQGPVETITPYVDEFIQFAKEHSELQFLVTPIGCGIAGFVPDEIAPLFREALNVDNITLPKSFHQVLEKSNIPHLVPKAVISQHYGQVRTLIDLAKALNSENHYSDFEKFATDFDNVIHEYQQRGLINEYSYSIFYRAWLVPTIQNNHPIEIDENELFNHIQNDQTIQSIFLKRGLSKLLRIIYYLNESQRYTNASQIEQDLMKIFPGLSHCSNSAVTLNDRSIFGIWYPACIVANTFTKQWEQFKDHNGILSNQKIEEYFIKGFEEKVEQLGLMKTIRDFYQNDGSCHPEVLVPKEYGRGPVFVKSPTGGCHFTYIKSCGEGKGPNASPDLYEFNVVKEIIKQSGKYDIVREKVNARPKHYSFEDIYLIPKEDFSLPIYIATDYYRCGKILFASERKKWEFILSHKPNAEANLHRCWSKEIDCSYPWM